MKPDTVYCAEQDNTRSAQHKQLLSKSPIQEGDFALLLCAGEGDDLPLVLDKVGSAGHVVAVESQVNRLSRARMRFGNKHNVDFLCGDVYAMRPMDGLYHVVVLTEALHLFTDPWSVVVRMACMLLPKGHLVITQPASSKTEASALAQQIEDLMIAAGLSVLVREAENEGCLVVGAELEE